MNIRQRCDCTPRHHQPERYLTAELPQLWALPSEMAGQLHVPMHYRIPLPEHNFCGEAAIQRH